MIFKAAPDTTYAVVVGIEKFDVGPAWNLDGPAHDALKFIKWLRRRWQVPAGQIFAFLSPLESNAAITQECEQEGVTARPAHGDGIRAVFSDTLPRKTGSLLLVYWGGHGVVTDSKESHLFYANATRTDKRNLVFDSWLKAGKRRSYQGFPLQVGIVDACANYFEDMRIVIGIPGDVIPAHESPAHNIVQLVMFASVAGQVAMNDNLRRTGAFSSFVLERLAEAETFPPDFVDVNRRTKEYFAAQRLDPTFRQMPVHYLWDGSDAGDGEERTGTLPGSHEMQRAAAGSGLSIAQIRSLAVELSRCASLQDRRKRDEFVALLGSQIRDVALVRDDDVVVDLQNIWSAILARKSHLSPFFAALARIEPDAYALQIARERTERLLHVASASAALANVSLSAWQLSTIWRASLPSAQATSATADLDAQLEALEEWGSRDGAASPLVEFMERVNRAAPNPDVAEWLQKQPAMQRAGVQARLDAKAALANRPRPYLAVMVRTARLKPGEGPEVEAWLWTGDVSTSKHWLCGCPPSFDGARAAFMPILAEARSIAADDLLVEFLVPREQLCLSPEQWEVAANDFSPSSILGQDHPVVLRWRERVREPENARRGSFIKRMASIVERTKHGLPPSVLWVSPETHDYQKLGNDLIGFDGECVGLLFVPPQLPAHNGTDLLVCALVGGAPILYWLRTEPHDWPSVKKKLAELATEGPIDTLPDRIWSIRRDPHSELADVLNLVWDRPDHLPQPVTATAPGQRTS